MSAGPRDGTAAALGVCLSTHVTKTARKRFSDRRAQTMVVCCGVSKEENKRKDEGDGRY